VQSAKIYIYTFSLSCLILSCDEKIPNTTQIDGETDTTTVITSGIENCDSLKDVIKRVYSKFYFIKHDDISIERMRTSEYKIETIEQDQIGELLFNAVIIDSIKKDHYSIKLFKSSTGSSISDFDYENQSDDLYIIGQSNLGEPVLYFIKRIGPFYGSVDLSSKIEDKIFRLDIAVKNQIYSRDFTFFLDLEKEFEQF